MEKKQSKGILWRVLFVISAANAIVLQFTAPVFVILFVELLYKQRTGKADIATCVAVLLGVVLFFVDGIRAGTSGEM